MLNKTKSTTFLKKFLRRSFYLHLFLQTHFDDYIRIILSVYIYVPFYDTVCVRLLKLVLKQCSPS